MKKEKKHSGWFWVVIVCGVVFLSLIEKPVLMIYTSPTSPNYEPLATTAGVLVAITMIVFALLIFFIARRVDAHFGYPKENGDAENENNNNEMQEMQERDSDQQ